MAHYLQDGAKQKIINAEAKFKNKKTHQLLIKTSYKFSVLIHRQLELMNH
jgi:hypothetical protein